MADLKAILTDVPGSDMLGVVDDFTSDGAANVSVIRQPDGKWTVEGLYLRDASAVNENGREPRRRRWWLTRERAESGA